VIDVSHTFAQNEILLTGGNGFLGKVVFGMLLDRYPQVKHLHLLVRPGQNQSAADRFSKDCLGSPALAALAAKLGDDFLSRKVSVWPGDVGRPYCGLEARTFDRLAGRVDLIINCAGRVDFFPPLDESFRSNVDGAEHVVALCRHWSAKLLHVSTSFVCGGSDGLVEETDPILGFYPHRKGPDDGTFSHVEELRYARDRIRQIYDSSGANGSAAASSAPSQTAQGSAAKSRDLAQRLIGLGKQRAEKWGWVNTYTYSKSLGEQIIAAAPHLDYAIVRPAIVESALRFPFPGWIEGGRTSAPLILMALGGLKDWPVREDAPLEVVPVDLVANAILIVAALLLEGQSERVYQLGSADVNPALLGSIVSLLARESSKHHKERNNHREPGFVYRLAGVGPSRRLRFLTAEEAHARRNQLQERIARTQSFISGVSKAIEKTWLPGKRTLTQWSMALRSLSLQTTFREQTLGQYLPFVQDHRYIFESENIRTACNLISPRDRELLPWDPERIDWKEYWINHQVKGTEKWIQPEAVREWAFKI